MFETPLLSPGMDPAPWVEMTFPQYRPLLHQPEQERFSGILVGALQDGVPAGLAIGAIARPGHPKPPELLSLYTAPAFRHQEVGTRLLQELLREMHRRGCTTVQTTWMTGKETTQWFERILQKTGWDAPQPRMAAVRSDLVELRKADPPWLRDRRRDPRFQIIGWDEVTAEQKEAMRQSHLREPWVKEDLMPSLHEKNYDAVTSCALLKDGQLVSWVINHLMKDGTTRFTCSFAHPRLQKYGVVFWLYKEASDRMERNGRRWCMWTIPLEHPGMHAFATRWMKPCSEYFRETFGSQKVLTPSSAAGPA